MKVKGPVACLLATLISVLATVTVAADTDTDSSATAAHGLRVSKAKEENRALEDLSHTQMWIEYEALKVEASAATLAVKKKKKEIDNVKCRKKLKCNLEGNSGIPVEPNGPAIWWRDYRRGHSYRFWENRPTYGNEIGCWDVSEVTNMDHAFQRKKYSNNSFNTPLCWDVSKVTSMKYMFYDAQFDQDISFWDVSSVKNFRKMFHNNTLDPDDVSAYFNLEDVSSVKNFRGMFHNNALDPDDVRAYFNLEDEDDDTEGL